MGAVTIRAKPRLIFNVVMHNGGRKKDQRPLATLAASVTGDAILRERREYVVHEARALEACHGSPQSGGERDFCRAAHGCGRLGYAVSVGEVIDAFGPQADELST